ncbi:MAG TPA: 2Fe-2S iron-sulfur cluster-binding protein [Actinomycetales bacterium]|nr:2Fe-2S iron-sulfur cluster-binding protein [Actinomycetales bacterium]
MNRSPAYRLGVQPGELLDRNRPLTFTWDGRRHIGYAGDTIASALAASGTRVLSRSFKYHRPRGILTASFVDPGCTVQVGAEPNVRAAHRRLQAGMVVEPQNVWPSLRYDVRAANQLVGRFLTAGFYYKTFIKPQRLWPLYERVLERFAAGGRVVAGPGPGHDEQGYYDQRYAHPDVVVAGAGPAGIGAALAAAQAGAQVLLVEEEYEVGGHLRWGGAEDLASLRELRAALEREPGVEVLVDSVVLGRYDDNWVSVLQRGLGHVTERLVKARTPALVAAPGLIERPYVFEGNDLPGVMLGTAVRRLVNLYAVRPGDRAVALVANPEGDAAVADLDRAGVDVVAVADARLGEGLRRAVGRGGLKAVELADGRVVECDLLVVSTGWTAPTSLLNMAGNEPVYDSTAARFRPGDGLPSSVLAAGGLVGDGSTEDLAAHGSTVGAAAAARAGFGQAQVPPSLPVLPHPGLFRASTHGFVDFSEDVSSADIVAAAAEGYDSSELVKRYTTATMGPSQGKLETVNTVAVLADAVGGTLEDLGTTVWRPPYAPVSLGALAGRSMQPVRRSPMHGWHAAHGARWLVAGQWLRPDRYGEPGAEVRAVRDGVGIIDVTPLGKLDLRGPDVPKLLEHVYVNRWSTLEVGSVRYGVMCSEDGVVMDDGVTGRLGPDRYLMSTTSSGAAAVWEHLEVVLQTEHPQWRVHVTPLTTAYASINIAGPRSRELLARVSDGVDLAPEVFGYMRVRTGRVAGVDDCFMWRIGFTGELSYEIHVPASYGLAVWEALLDHGSDLGVAPFGVEAQRILRLEKGHIVVGQDTDGLTDAFEAGLGALVKLDKEDFVGRPELAGRRSGQRRSLVGIQTVDPLVVPPEASQVVGATGRLVGRITSSRMSPTLGRSIALGFVPTELAEPGSEVTVALPDGRRVTATVTATTAHVDPEGSRLRG